MDFVQKDFRGIGSKKGIIKINYPFIKFGVVFRLQKLLPQQRCGHFPQNYRLRR